MDRKPDQGGARSPKPFKGVFIVIAIAALMVVAYFAGRSYFAPSGDGGSLPSSGATQGTARIGGPFNLVAPQPTTSAEFARELGRALGRPAGLATPGFALKILFGEMADEMLLNGQRALPKRLQEAGYTFRFPTLTGALEDILR